MIPETGPTSPQGLLALACLGIHLSYFFLIKTLVPSFGKDRRNLSWLLTLVTATVLSLAGFLTLRMYTRTTFSRPILYEEYSHTPGSGFYRYDIAYTPATFQKLSPAEALLYLNAQANGTEDIQDPALLVEARIAFYKAYDRTQTEKPWYSRATFFDTRFQPGDSPLGQFFATFFAMYLVADLACGIRYYKEKITFLSGWVHHIGYLIIAYHTIFIAKEAHTFSAFFLIERKFPFCILAGNGHPF